MYQNPDIIESALIESSKFQVKQLRINNIENTFDRKAYIVNKKLIFEIKLLVDKEDYHENLKWVPSVFHIYYLVDSKGKCKTIEKLHDTFISYFDDLRDEYVKVCPQNAEMLLQQSQFREDIKAQIQYYSRKHKGTIKVLCKNPEKMIIRIYHYLKEKKANKIKDDFEDLMNEYKVEARKIEFIPYLPPDKLSKLSDGIFNILNEHKLERDFTIENGTLTVRFMSNLNKTKKIK